ncbi:propionate catabolism operon regulatory protein PrpR [Simplicispira psychrophila]|uniref:propionate catabolism operon regulatory protein PrpR n=1 Tax=Simplicispira psychrophila TaxID=80882 RepID=UPI00047F3431|nr:propionate catabolism operon regulatory protein PrpR [Simplicispira psychrophila]
MNETFALPHIVTVGRHRIARVLERAAEGFESQARITHLSASFDAAVDAVLALHARTPIDALVVAGASGAWIRGRVDIPVAMIEVRGFDLLGALARARALSPPNTQVALVTFGAVSEQVAQFDVQFGAGIVQFSYHGSDDAAACVHALQAAGIGAVVAPGLVADLAEEVGIASVLLYSDVAVKQALNEALLVARQRLAERTRHQRLETILSQLQDGVVAVDCQQRIQALNPAMAALLGAPAAQWHGRALGVVAPQLDMARTLQYQESSEDVVQLATRTQVVRRAPMVENGQLTGALLVCRDPHTIHSADRHLRANQRQRQGGVGGVRWRIDDFLGDSPAVQRLRTLALQCAVSDATVLILGESGTGKELVAQGIHRASRRALQPFLAVNCAALGESLLESELFGYEEGAFTGARRGGKTGLVEAAHTGTLFLDEIGDMPLALQSRLLRVLQEREVLRIGSTTPVPVDVRVIAATHADLAAQVDQGLFRRDLYYRLAVLRLSTPALRERSCSDVAQLAQALLQRRLKALAIEAPAVLQTLLTTVLQRAHGHCWRGNVRELENWVERLLACHASLCDAQGTVDAARLQEIFPECADPLAPRHLKDTRRQAEQQRLREVLESVGGDQRQACEILGISRATLWRRMKANRMAVDGAAA